MKNDAQAVRDWSVYPVLIDDETFTYAKVRALEGALGVGRRVQFQREREEWCSGRVVEMPDGHTRGGGTVCIRA